MKKLFAQSAHLTRFAEENKTPRPQNRARRKRERGQNYAASAVLMAFITASGFSQQTRITSPVGAVEI